MNYSVGPFNLIALLSVMLILYVCAIYFIIKKRLGIETVLLMIFFPYIGSIVIIFYSLFIAKKDSRI
ncbi:hypothetical protein SAMN05421796_1176 [Chryseobacterium piscicola]|uniref:Uncharacterized protein n=1 Tax=Chryseobacterium piscicola TaxID=551459 RepID=A0A1N7PI81_9FLAO|nr:hypothetical protein SAMN05421796_1176 [Chryseobacterium piscicola]